MEYLALKTVATNHAAVNEPWDCDAEATTTTTASTFAHYQDVLEMKSRTALPPLRDAHDVLIQVAYSDVNAMDLQTWHATLRALQRADVRLYKQGDGDSEILGGAGHGGTGTVLAVGDAAPRQWVGKAVCFLTTARRQPSFATHVVVDARCVASLPSVQMLREAATIPVAGCTAYQALASVGLARHALRVATTQATPKDQCGDPTTKTTLAQVGGTTSSSSLDTTNAPSSLLVVGGSGGVGSWILTLVKAWHPHVVVTTTASTTAHQTWCQETLGARGVCTHDAADLQRTCTNGVDTVIWCGTQPPMAKQWQVLCDVVNSYGTICFVTQPSSNNTLNLALCWHKSVKVTIVNVLHSIETNFRHIQPSQQLQVLLELLASQRIHAPISPWQQGDPKQCRIQEKFKSILADHSVLHYLSQRNSKNEPDCHYAGNLVLCINAGVHVLLVDVKTASLVSMSRNECIQQKVIPTVATTAASNGRSGDVVWKDAAKGSEREKLVKILKDHPTLGILTALERKQIVEDIGLQEAENVKNLWGVSLKKRQRNKEGEEVIFIDPLTETLVELVRDDVLARKVFTVRQNDSNQQEVIEENVTGAEERDELIQKIRKVLRLLGE